MNDVKISTHTESDIHVPVQAPVLNHNSSLLFKSQVAPLPHVMWLPEADQYSAGAHSQSTVRGGATAMARRARQVCHTVYQPLPHQQTRVSCVVQGTSVTATQALQGLCIDVLYGNSYIHMK